MVLVVFYLGISTKTKSNIKKKNVVDPIALSRRCFTLGTVFVITTLSKIPAEPILSKADVTSSVFAYSWKPHHSITGFTSAEDCEEEEEEQEDCIRFVLCAFTWRPYSGKPILNLFTNDVTSDSDVPMHK